MDANMENRKLCPDGSCLGVLDEAGNCSVCGLNPRTARLATTSSATAEHIEEIVPKQEALEFTAALERQRQQEAAAQRKRDREETKRALGQFLDVLTWLVIVALVAYAAWSWRGEEVMAYWHSWDDKREMSTCRGNLQADLDEFWGPTKDPTVTKCSGRSEEAICLVKSLYDGNYKTLPFVANCSKRHFERGLRTKVRNTEEQKRWDAQLAEFWRDFQVAK
jgi:hypothetical protein